MAVEEFEPLSISTGAGGVLLGVIATNDYIGSAGFAIVARFGQY